MPRPKKIKSKPITLQENVRRFMDVPKETVILNDMTQEPLKAKTLGLFDHLKQVTSIQDKKYFSKITDGDKRTWSNFMVNRFLSMEPDFIDLINETQKYTVGGKMPPECMYKMLIDVIPKAKVFLQYIKGKTEGKYKPELIEIVKTYFMVSKAQAMEYVDILHRIGKVQDLRELLERYGYEEEQIKKMVT